MSRILAMNDILTDIIEQIRACGRALETAELLALLRVHNRNIKDSRDHVTKKKLMPYYLRIKQDEERFEALKLDPETEKLLLATLQIKPRRTASGVATITVITKPWMCSSNCRYCPCDLRMPKSYLSDEPACQRAERNYFDPYLQVASRLAVLQDMGHVTDKIELIVLGGTWSDYPRAYQIWFVRELFRALNDDPQTRRQTMAKRRAWYQSHGISSEREVLIEETRELQTRIFAGALSFNQGIKEHYFTGSWADVSAAQTAEMEELFAEHVKNEDAKNRVVGLVIETQPDSITPESLRLIRALGATKVQIGVQSLRQDILELNRRHISVGEIQRAFSLLRLFGFKIHAHVMANLLGADPESDIQDYARFVTDAPYQPDEIKLYPCALIQGTDLVQDFESGRWQPYDEETLVNVLVEDVLATPPFIRISRMIRDFSAHDIVAGNKKVNLRQLVELTAENRGIAIQEIRYREISTASPLIEKLKLSDYRYQTLTSEEHFLSWVTPEGKLAGFLRLSLPHQDYVAKLGDESPVGLKQAMIREIHIYGKVAAISKSSQGAQHLGLGRRLIAHAEKLARQAGYTKLNVISAIGTRGYYRSCGFGDAGLYQQKDLSSEES